MPTRSSNHISASSVPERDDRAAEPHGPTSHSICKEEAFELVRCIRGFCPPRGPTVARVKQRTSGTHSITFGLIKKLHVEQISSNT
jgi:hypothetical protein